MCVVLLPSYIFLFMNALSSLHFIRMYKGETFLSQLGRRVYTKYKRQFCLTLSQCLYFYCRTLLMYLFTFFTHANIFLQSICFPLRGMGVDCNRNVSGQFPTDTRTKVVFRNVSQGFHKVYLSIFYLSFIYLLSIYLYMYLSIYLSTYSSDY